MKELVFFLEEDSAKALLHSLVPRLIGTDSAVRYVVLEGKQDMKRQLVGLLENLDAWLGAFRLFGDYNRVDQISSSTRPRISRAAHARSRS